MRIRIFPDPVLRIRSEPILKVTDYYRRLIRDMSKAMNISGGIGLAANQIGVPQRIMLIDFEEEIEVLINPEIISRSEKMSEEEEGCLSFPELYVLIKRPISIDIKYLDENNNMRKRTVEDIFARVFMHEFDHLNGKLIIDYMPNEQKLAYNMQINKKE
ncbi:peptide deformylase [candidate division WOR-3 bacterium]|nr:peptide deformylase [candidate division WOR-3 bacterium]